LTGWLDGQRGNWIMNQRMSSKYVYRQEPVSSCGGQAEREITKNCSSIWLTQILKEVKNCPFILIVPDCDASAGDAAEIFSDYVHKIGSFILEMNFPAASHGASMAD
jgi:hypothetical protein